MKKKQHIHSYLYFILFYLSLITTISIPFKTLESQTYRHWITKKKVPLCTYIFLSLNFILHFLFYGCWMRFYLFNFHESYVTYTHRSKWDENLKLAIQIKVCKYLMKSNKFHLLWFWFLSCSMTTSIWDRKVLGMENK
jgi:hypothetical protein